MDEPETVRQNSVEIGNEPLSETDSRVEQHELQGKNDLKSIQINSTGKKKSKNGKTGYPPEDLYKKLMNGQHDYSQYARKQHPYERLNRITNGPKKLTHKKTKRKSDASDDKTAALPKLEAPNDQKNNGEFVELENEKSNANEESIELVQETFNPETKPTNPKPKTETQRNNDPPEDLYKKLMNGQHDYSQYARKQHPYERLNRITNGPKKLTHKKTKRKSDASADKTDALPKLEAPNDERNNGEFVELKREKSNASEESIELVQETFTPETKPTSPKPKTETQRNNFMAPSKNKTGSTAKPKPDLIPKTSIQLVEGNQPKRTKEAENQNSILVASDDWDSNLGKHPLREPQRGAKKPVNSQNKSTNGLQNNKPNGRLKPGKPGIQIPRPNSNSLGQKKTKTNLKDPSLLNIDCTAAVEPDVREEKLEKSDKRNGSQDSPELGLSSPAVQEHEGIQEQISGSKPEVIKSDSPATNDGSCDGDVVEVDNKEEVIVDEEKKTAKKNNSDTDSKTVIPRTQQKEMSKKSNAVTKGPKRFEETTKGTKKYMVGKKRAEGVKGKGNARKTKEINQKTADERKAEELAVTLGEDNEDVIKGAEEALNDAVVENETDQIDATGGSDDEPKRTSTDNQTPVTKDGDQSIDDFFGENYSNRINSGVNETQSDDPILTSRQIPDVPNQISARSPNLNKEGEDAIVDSSGRSSRKIMTKKDWLISKGLAKPVPQSNKIVDTRIVQEVGKLKLDSESETKEKQSPELSEEVKPDDELTEPEEPKPKLDEFGRKIRTKSAILRAKEVLDRKDLTESTENLLKALCQDAIEELVRNAEQNDGGSSNGVQSPADTIDLVANINQNMGSQKIKQRKKKEEEYVPKRYTFATFRDCPCILCTRKRPKKMKLLVKNRKKTKNFGGGSGEETNESEGKGEKGEDGVAPKTLVEAATEDLLQTNEAHSINGQDPIETNASGIVVQRILEMSASLPTSQLLWRITDVKNKIRSAKRQERLTIYSPTFYTAPHGYKMMCATCPFGSPTGFGKYLPMYFFMCRGKWDNLLPWPFAGDVTVTLLDQNPDRSERQDLVFSFKPDASDPMLNKSLCQPTKEWNSYFGLNKFAPLKCLSPTHFTYVRDDTMFLQVFVRSDRMMVI